MISNFRIDMYLILIIKILAKIIFLCVVAFMLNSCSADTYNFISVNDPFMDTSQLVNIRVAGGIASKEIQTTAKVYKNVVVGVSGFGNYMKNNYSDIARFAGSGFLSNTFHLSDNKRWGLNLAAGYTLGDVNTPGTTYISSQYVEIANSRYTSPFLQLGFQMPVDKTTNLKVFVKYNHVHFNKYYYSIYYGSVKESDITHTDIVQFTNKNIGFTEVVFLLKQDYSPLFSLFLEAGYSHSLPFFDVKNYRMRENHNISRTSSKEFNETTPHFFPVILRIGLEFKITKSIFERKEDL